MPADHILSAIEKDAKAIKPVAEVINDIGTFLKTLIWVVGGVCTAVLAVAAWVWNTNSSLAADSAAIKHFKVLHDAELKDNTDWRAAKDKESAQILLMIQNQQKMLDHQQALWDAVLLKQNKS